MTPDMEWETPPPASRYNWEEVSATLRANPTAWLKIFDDGPVSVVNAIRQGQVRHLSPVRPGRHATIDQEGFEVRTRNNRTGPPRMCTLYLRWVPANTIGEEPRATEDHA